MDTHETDRIRSKLASRSCEALRGSANATAPAKAGRSLPIHGRHWKSVLP